MKLFNYLASLALAFALFSCEQKSSTDGTTDTTKKDTTATAPADTTKQAADSVKAKADTTKK
ncbi:MAG: hypothetical protein NZ529_06015 [Cytophagaceae bacterium]|nr:hypothetical protein [Cytophagaceae bacterium]MDW8456334.1 hypothetical protein [Cytophagaceae bacterium]